MAKLHVIVQFCKKEVGEEVTLMVLGSYSDLKRLSSTPLLAAHPHKNLRKGFLCGPSSLTIPCGSKCTDHNNFLDFTDDVLQGVAFTHEFKEIKAAAKAAQPDPESVLAPTIDQADLAQVTPALAADLRPAPLALGTLVEPTSLSPTRTSTVTPGAEPKRTFTELERQRLLVVIAQDVEITLSDKSVDLRFYNRAAFDLSAEDAFRKIGKFIRHELRHCGYEFTTRPLSVIEHVEDDQYLSGKMPLSKVGDYDQALNKLPVMLAIKIQVAKMRSAP
jgi:hypothetical protein